jgi:hypothetical protein
MPSVPTLGRESTLAAEDEFLAIVCSDEDLVQAEFDAIIAAQWPGLPPDPPEDDDAVERSPGPMPIPPIRGRARLSDRPHHPGIGGWSRERSPPPRQAAASGRQEGR